MKSYENLYQLADSIDLSWCESEKVDWSEAEQLIRACQKIEKSTLDTLPEIQEIIEYAKKHEDWDSAYVVVWPELVQSDLEHADKLYGYRAYEDHWEVYSLSLTGDEEWKAFVETESIALNLVELLQPEPERKH